MYRSEPCCLVQARKEVEGESSLLSELAAARWEVRFARREVVSSVLDVEGRTIDGPPTMIFLCHCQKKNNMAFEREDYPVESTSFIVFKVDRFDICLAASYPMHS
jgi:hypothetical protein